ncbi:MAG: hypothetical protein GY913_04740 [Proteobacteria bacterium]|nr:hypothetical protein [Pseudomonadota bacterium]MCP4916208.1 hypothetical protein [Pseudomonadota bacterium]
MLFLFATAYASSLPEVQDALAKGDCQLATEVAGRWIALSPDDAAAWRAQGDSARCSGDSRAALVSYRKALSLKPDAGLEALIGSLASDLSSVQVSLTGADAEIAPLVTALYGDTTIESANGLLRDLPQNTDITVTIGGPGYNPVSQKVTTPAAGVLDELTVPVTFLGWSTLTVGEIGEGVTVLLDDAELAAGEQQVLAGSHTLVVTGETGRREDTLSLDADGSHAIEPMQLLPASVTLLGIPEGTTLTFPEGEPVTVARGEGELDETLGIRVVQSVAIEGLDQGEHTYTFTHPIFGTVEGRFFAVAGQVSAEPVPWRALETVDALAQEYAAHTAEQGGVGTAGWIALGGSAAAVAGGGLAGLSFSKLGLPLAAQDEAQTRYDAMVAAGRESDANDAYLDLAVANAAVRRYVVRGSIAGGVGALGIAATTYTIRTIRKSKNATAWNPWGEA